jgi:uncharacterized protein (TIGR02246 family)
MKRILFALGLSLLPLVAHAESEKDLVDHFLTAWNAADAKALGALFTPAADFVSPFGQHARGRDAIQAFYTTVFANGFAGSKGTGEIVNARALSPDLMLVDARFTISRPQKEEKGIMAAIFRRDGDVWRIEALRENESASDFSDFPPR